MTRTQRIPILIALALTVLTAGASHQAIAASAPSASAFSERVIWGVDWSPAAFTPGLLDYTLTLHTGAGLLFGGYEYRITQVWGFYAVNKTGSSANDFVAGGVASGDWSWGQKASSAGLSVAGWGNPSKKEALITPASGSVSRVFRFDEFTYSGATPLPGLHVSVYVPEGMPSPFGSGNTGPIIPKAVPEPGALLSLCVGMTGLAGSIRRGRA